MRKTIYALLALATLYGAAALGNYSATPGSGLSFGSVVVAGIHYAQQFVCDLTTPSQCVTVNSDGTMSVKGVGVVAESTTSGQTMSPVGCATTTSAPTYGTGKTDFLSCDTAGNTRTVAPATTNAGAAVVKGGVGVVNGGSTYQAVAASQTATVLQTSAGAIGDYLSHCVLYPTSTSPGVVTVFDNTNAAAGSPILFPGGASSLSNLAPIPIPVGAVSTAGAWKVTTGASISVVCYGKFS